MKLLNVLFLCCLCFGARVLSAQGFESSVSDVGESLAPGLRALRSAAESRRPRATCVARKGAEILRGDRVHDALLGNGTVIEVLWANEVRVRYDYEGKQRIRPIDTLGRGIGCFDRIHRDDRVYDPHFGPGHVAEVFDDGWARLAFDSHSNYHDRPVQGLGRKEPCYRGVCAGSRVIDSSLSKAGRVREVFDNGMAVVGFDDRTNRWYYRPVADLNVEPAAR